MVRFSKKKHENDLGCESVRTQFSKPCKIFPKSTAHDYFYKLATFQVQMIDD